jgi:hypothetical protein
VKMEAVWSLKNGMVRDGLMTCCIPWKSIYFMQSWVHVIKQISFHCKLKDLNANCIVTSRLWTLYDKRAGGISHIVDSQ